MPCFLASWLPSSLIRASTRRWFSVCGAGMNSSLETLWVGIGPGNAAVSEGRTALSSSSLSSLMRSPFRGGWWREQYCRLEGLSIVGLRSGRELLQHERAERGGVEGGGLARGRGRLGLETGLADDDANGGGGVDLPVREQAGQHRERGRACRPRPYALGPRQHRLRGQDLLVLRLARHAARLSQDAQDPIAFSSWIARGQSFGNGVADLERGDRRLVPPRCGNGVGARCLGGGHDWPLGDEAPALHLGEAAMRGDESLAHRHGCDDDIRCPPPELLGDLVRDGLLALVLVWIARGAAVEEEALLGQVVPVGDQVVVQASVEDEVAGRGRHVEHLGRRGPLVAEDERPQAGARRIGGDGGARVARADHRGGGEAELQRGAHRRGRRAVLDRAGGVRALELDEQALDAELSPQARALEQRRLPFPERDAVGGVGDGQDGRVAPETAAREGRGAEALERGGVVHQLEKAAALRALQRVTERLSAVAVDAAKARRQRVRHERLPKRCSITASISSMR